MTRVMADKVSGMALATGGSTQSSAIHLPAASDEPLTIARIPKRVPTKFRDEPPLGESGLLAIADLRGEGELP